MSETSVRNNLQTGPLSNRNEIGIGILFPGRDASGVPVQVAGIHLAKNVRTIGVQVREKRVKNGSNSGHASCIGVASGTSYGVP